MRIPLALTLLCTVCTPGAFAGEAPPLRPGDATLRPSPLRPYTNSWRYYVTTPAGKIQELGTWRDQLSETSIRGERYLLRTQVWARPIGIVSTTLSLFDPVTLLPLSGTQQASDGSFVYREFSAGKIKERKLDQGADKVEPAELSIDGPVFDMLGGLWGDTLPALPLREGYKTRLVSVGEAELKIVTVNIAVRGREEVASGGGSKKAAWKVEVEFGQPAMYFWVIQEPPYVLKLEMVDQRGNTWRWEMV